ncbi:thrombospondin type 3 repeat-containing protein [Allomuricauda sp. d1]|uniref:thrombospondin type 3 repeat-containing protein n=1 Tax=Allomuricauda sp. d1 TaxID=3136725 RepID=UPI0031DBFF30
MMLALSTMTFIACSSDDNGDGGNDDPQIADADGDGVEDSVDNCPNQANADQADNDNDGVGNVCDATPDGDGAQPGDTIEVDNNITSDTTWDSDFIYQLNGRIAVESGATLTIEAGTLIKGSAGQGTNASALIVARGATLNANGTADDPIIFTSTADNIDIGETVSPNLTANDRGLWGGLIVLGAAPISVADNSGTAQIEGIPATDANGNYGGTTADDSSGTITYVSVRHGGTNIGDGNEINGITFGGVGSGTTVNHIEVLANVDDGVEFFGGTVNVTNVVVWAQGDDAIDIDQAYSGTIDNAVVVQGSISDHALEIDGPEGTATGEYTLQNATLFGLSDNAEDGEIADFRSGATGANNNIFVTGFTGVGTDLQLSDVELDAGDADDNATISNNYTAGTLSFMNWEVVLPAGVAAVADIFDEKLDPTTTDFETAPFASAVTTGTVGADTSVFGWTVTSSESGASF